MSIHEFSTGACTKKNQSPSSVPFRKTVFIFIFTFMCGFPYILWNLPSFPKLTRETLEKGVKYVES